MPTTYNGVGTHYYGKKNLHKRNAPCPHCGQQVELTSYDTRLWVVFIFIPIFPLGRKRILDQCPACTRHFAVEAEKWETAKQLELSGAQDKYRSSQSADDAIALHQQFMNFHQFEPAAEFRTEMKAKFADNAKVHAYLGSVLEHFGKDDEAAGFFARAFELRPDLPEARIGVARAHMQAGRTDEARTLLDFLEKPGAAQLYSLEPIDQLSRVYQNAGKHEDALALFAIIQRELPHIAEQKWFRKLVEKSEKALGRSASQLPKQKFSLRRLFSGGGAAPGQPQANARTLLAIGIFLALFVLGFAISNEYIRRNRVLYVVNAFNQPATVRIAGGGSVDHFRGVQQLTLKEGTYHAVVSGPVTEEFDFTVHAGYFDRWFGDTLWLLNVGGKAALVQTVAVYRQDPEPASIYIRFGKSFETFADITHPFKELPSSVKVDRGGTKTLSKLEVHDGEAVDVCSFLVGRGEESQALDFAEASLKAEPEDEYMLRLYAGIGMKLRQTNRLDAFLKAGLAARPVRIEWHRVYQNLHDKPASRPALTAEYQKQLSADPGNAALLYLCGRLEPDRAKSHDYFTRAATADPSNAYPQFALGFERMTSGEWPAAHDHFERAIKLRPKDQGFLQWLTLSRFATGDTAGLEKDAKAMLKRDPSDFGAAVQLVLALAVQDRRADADAAVNQFRSAAQGRFASRAPALTATLQCHLLYAFGDFAGLEKTSRTIPRDSHGFLVQALLEEGRPADALKSAAKQDDSDEKAIFDLAVALSFRQAGDAQQAEHYLAKGREALAQGNEDSVKASELLGRGVAGVTAEQLRDVTLPPQLKAAIAANLAALPSPNRAAFATLATSLNVDRTFPYHLIRRTTDAVK